MKKSKPKTEMIIAFCCVYRKDSTVQAAQALMALSAPKSSPVRVSPFTTINKSNWYLGLMN